MQVSHLFIHSKFQFIVFHPHQLTPFYHILLLEIHVNVKPTFILISLIKICQLTNFLLAVLSFLSHFARSIAAIIASDTQKCAFSLPSSSAGSENLPAEAKKLVTSVGFLSKDPQDGTTNGDMNCGDMDNELPGVNFEGDKWKGSEGMRLCVFGSGFGEIGISCVNASEHGSTMTLRLDCFSTDLGVSSWMMALRVRLFGLFGNSVLSAGLEDTAASSSVDLSTLASCSCFIAASRLKVDLERPTAEVVELRSRCLVLGALNRLGSLRQWRSSGALLTGSNLRCGRVVERRVCRIEGRMLSGKDEQRR